jgi:hypothetical protein
LRVTSYTRTAREITNPKPRVRLTISERSRRLGSVAAFAAQQVLLERLMELLNLDQLPRALDRDSQGLGDGSEHCLGPLVGE